MFEKIIRNCFRAGYKLYQDIRKEYAGFTILSMGMSADYEIPMLDRKKMKFNLEQLSVPIEKLKNRVEFTRKMYGKWNY